MRNGFVRCDVHDEIASVPVATATPEGNAWSFGSYSGGATE